MRAVVQRRQTWVRSRPNVSSALPSLCSLWPQGKGEQPSLAADTLVPACSQSDIAAALPWSQSQTTRPLRRFFALGARPNIRQWRESGSRRLWDWPCAMPCCDDHGRTQQNPTFHRPVSKGQMTPKAARALVKTLHSWSAHRADASAPLWGYAKQPCPVTIRA